MVWVKRSLAHLLSLLLFVFLIGMVFATTAHQTFGQPQKLEAILHDSGIYNTLTDSLLKQAQQDNTNGQDTVVSLSNPAVQQAAKSALSPQLMEQSVDQFLNGNYAWLEGKSDKPTFAINLADAKNSFVQQIATATEQHVKALPVCTPAELSQIDLNNIDYLSLTCRPPSLSAQAASQTVQTQLTNGDFLPQPVLTPENVQQTTNTGFTDTSSTNKMPYYLRLSDAPKTFRWSQQLPWILLILALFSAIGIIFLSATKRRGARQVSVVLAIAGLALVVGKFLTDALFNAVQDKLTSSSATADFRLPIIDVLHKIETHIVRLNLLFGGVFLAVGIIVFVLLHFVKKPPAPKAVAQTPTTPPPSTEAAPTTPRPSVSPTAPRPTPTQPPRSTTQNTPTQIKVKIQ